jgi:hypothetical protein
VGQFFENHEMPLSSAAGTSPGFADAPVPSDYNIFTAFCEHCRRAGHSIPGKLSPERLLLLIGGLRLDRNGAMNNIIPGSADTRAGP